MNVESTHAIMSTYLRMAVTHAGFNVADSIEKPCHQPLTIGSPHTNRLIRRNANPDVSLAMCRSISVDMFQKAMDLDLRWHLMRKTGEVTRIMDRGTSAIQQVLSTGDGLASPMAFTLSAAEPLRDCTCFSAQ